MNCQIDLYAGLLGCGKTTLIKRLLETEYAGARVAIIENEIGKVNLDAVRLQQPEIRITQITGGCVCCTVRGEFTKAVDLLAEQVEPDYIVIEPTGAADIGGLLDACRMARRASLRRLVMIVNARKFLLLLQVVGTFYLEQIEAATCIYLNFTEQMPAEARNAVREKIREINPDVRIIDTPLQEITRETFRDTGRAEKASGHGPVKAALEVLPAEEKKPVRILAGRNNRRTIYTRTLEFPEPLSERQFEELMQKLAREGEDGIWRAKGILAMESGEKRCVDMVFGDVFTEEDDLPGEAEEFAGRLVLIGPGVS
ncbi:MAG: GTP-binding protein [Blautia sp.]|nr:GTP-binding protein [Blautia sp.]